MDEKDKLPLWSDCELAVDEDRATSLEKFIYDYEPGDNDRAWRERLLAALTTVRKEAREAAFRDAANAVRAKAKYLGQSDRQVAAQQVNGCLRAIDAIEAAANTEEGAGSET